jgi:hypothetical protein
MRHRPAVAESEALTQAARAVRSALRVAGRWRSEARHKFERTRDQRPLQIVAAVAGTALLIGALLRVWRSQVYE